MSCEGYGLTPLYILQVSLAGPRTTVEAQTFYRMYHSYADIPNPWDRLRWCRYGLDLLQKEVAAMVIFLRSNENARLQATICGSADGRSLWSHPDIHSILHGVP